MPTSRSPPPATEQPASAGSRFHRPLISIAIVAALAVVVIALPASTLRRFLPDFVRADDFSGTVWHGSAGSIAVGGRSIGAVEWHIRPWSLSKLTLTADVHWVKAGVVADGTVELESHVLTLRNVQGGGPIEDLRDLAIADAWRGNTTFKFSELRMVFQHGSSASGAGGAGGAGGAVTLASMVGDFEVADLASPRIADGADLGGYRLHAANVAITPGTDATAELADTGGPLEFEAVVHISPDGHTGMLSGTIKARADAPPALRAELENLVQLHAPDARGAIPVELEFTL